jgi:hypothetical protein
MTDKLDPAPRSDDLGKPCARELRERPGGPTQDELLDEALKETFPASDPTSVYRIG